ncbi:hypothetical protein [Halopseudomonas sp.]|uniref:hypothetical protein n=1 Tax=Halopseudomonas sp. TaxID=2901191 RepID=UPI0035661CFE
MKAVRLFAVSALSVSVLLTTGCASILSDSQYPVSMTSTPPGATFEVRNETGATVHSGVTPGMVTLKSGDGFFSGANYTVVFKKEGYADKTNSIAPSLDGWYVGNILFGGLIGLLVVDPATGAMYKLPDRSAATLAPLAAANAQDDPSTLNIMSIAALTEGQKSELIRIN